jgi:hypothetical protein
MTTTNCPNCGAKAAGDRCAECGAPLTSAGRAAKQHEKLNQPRPKPEPVDEPEAVMLVERAREARSQPTDVERSAKAREKGAAAYLALQPSEQAVLHAASRIFSAWIVAGKVTDDNHDELADRAVKTATRMALVTDRYLQADAEDW